VPTTPSVQLDKGIPGPNIANQADKILHTPGTVFQNGLSAVGKGVEHLGNEIGSTHPVSTPGRRAGQPWRSGGSRSGLLGRLPIPREQVGDFVDGVIWKPGQHIREPSLRINVVHLAGLCRPPNYAERVWYGAPLSRWHASIACAAAPLHSA